MVETFLSRLAGMLSRPAPVLGMLAGYTVLHFVLRLAMSPTIEVDHVEQAIFSQTFEFLYGLKQPPLYTWLQAGMNAVLGVSVASFVGLKYIFFLAMVVLYFLSARRILNSTAWASVSVLSLLLLYQIGWKIHLGITHTAMVMFACAGTLWVLLRLAQDGRGLALYGVLGVMVGLGMMAKYGYFACLAGLLVALALQPGGRRVLADRRIGLAAALAVAMFAPLALGIVEAAGSGERLATASTGGFQGYLAGLPRAFGELAVSILAFLAPMIVVLPALAPRVLRLRPRVSSAATDGFDAGLFIAHTLAAIVTVLVLMVVTGAMSGFKERWMHPFLLFAPILCIVLVRRAVSATPDGETKFFRRFVAVTLAFAALVLTFRVGQGFFGPPFCNRCRILVPYSDLADAAFDRGFRGGVIVAQDEHIGGNLRVRFPEAQVHVPTYPFYTPRPERRIGPETGSQCLIAWEDRDGTGGLPADLARFATDRAGVRAMPGTAGVPVDAVWAYGGANPDFHWRFLTFSAGQAGCAPGGTRE